MIAKFLVFVLSLSLLAGCNSNPATPSNATFAGINSSIAGLNAADNALARLSNGYLPAACGIVYVAEGYFTTLKSKISAKNQLIEAKAAAGVNAICANPPTSVAAALASLLPLWMTIQNATISN